MEDPAVLFDPYISAYKQRESGQKLLTTFMAPRTDIADKTKKRTSRSEQITAKKKPAKRTKRKGRDPNQHAINKWFS